ncbi:MAG: efflux RND transporter permease subunit, partial [Pseudobdellovibrionaceae bacterium]|nr:efflux RND transporter permease subunit [Pseudobdellovibrionaceae bacterium]
PIATGYGEGGRVLQPLGIAVVGGLWLSTLLTLLVVPLLHSLRLHRQDSRRSRSAATAATAVMIIVLGSLVTPRAEARELTLDQQRWLVFMDELIANDPTWKKAESEITRQEELLPILKGSALPELSASMRRESLLELQGADRSENRMVFAGKASLNLYRFGQDKARWTQAEAASQALQHERRVIRLEAETRITTLLFDLWAAEDEAALDLKIRTLRERLLKVANQQYEQGLLAAQERQKIELDRQSIELAARESQQKVEIGRRAIGLLKGEPWPSGRWFMRNTAGDLPGDRDQVLMQHPRYAAVAARTKAAQAETDSLWAGQMPSLDFMGEVGRAVSERDSWGTTTNFALVFTVPILSGLEPSSRYRSQVQVEAGQGYELENVRRDLLLDFENQRLSLRREGEAVCLREGFVQTVRGIYEAGLKRFERGLVSVNDLSTDENRLYSYEREHNTGLRQYHQTLVAACHSFGWALKECLAHVQNQPEAEMKKNL